VKTSELDYLDGDSIKAAAEKFGDVSLDVLINCAGLSQASLSCHYQV
jgi:NAD(P)-dependent dehydrogenase (short-subunit alcohol dehydrogenase family)